MNVKTKVETISTDFSEQNEPFDDVTFPEERLLSEVTDRIAPDGETVSLSMEDRAKLVSAFATFDYNRDANQLVDNLLDFQEHCSELFDSWKVNSEGELQAHFENIGFRYPSRDAHAWATNCEILRHKYHGKWTELFLDVGADAEALVERLEDDDFLCLKGVKIAPMYARIINDDVCELSSLWDLEIPVDTHIRRLSLDLFDAPDKDDDWIRQEWRGLAVEADIDRQVVDGALWHIGNKWNDWGEDYWNSL
jgi:hypothetical protein